MPIRSKISRSSQPAPGQTGTSESTTGSAPLTRVRNLILVPVWPGNQVVIQFEARLDRETVDRCGVRQKIELQISATKFCGGAKKFSRHYQRRFTMKFDDFRNRLRVPLAKAFGYNISVLTATLCHDLSDFARLATYASRARPFSKDRNSRPAGSRCKSSFRKSHIARGCEKPPPKGREKSLPRRKE